MELSLSEIARLLGAQGGRAKAKKLTDSERSRNSSRMAQTRWAALTPEQRSEIGRVRQRAKQAKAISNNKGDGEGTI